MVSTTSSPKVQARQNGFSADVERWERARPKQWRVIVWNVAPQHSGLMARFKLIPAKRNPTTFWRAFPRDQRNVVVKLVATLKSAGLHGIARLVDKPHKTIRHHSKPRVVSDRSGFGGALNATPIRGSWRRRSRR